MSKIEKSHKVAVVGSPSSNYEVSLDLNSQGRSTPLVGTMLALTNPLGEGEELAIGTVTEVTTTNKWMEENAFRGVASTDEGVSAFSGDAGGDLRSAKIRLQASWRKNNVEDEIWIPSGPSLRMSPSTGQAVRLVDESIIEELTASVSDKHYVGHLGGTDGIRLPLSIPDFAGPAGAQHIGVYGQSGSGKALALDTLIPTPSGWTTMGDLKTGDQVFDENGKPCTVVQAHEVLLGRECYEVSFSDGTKIIADADHLWETESAYARYRESLERRGAHKRMPLLPVEIRENLKRIASESSSTDLITMSEIEALTGLSHSSSILRRAARAVGSSGTVVPVYAFKYSGNKAIRTSNLPTYPAVELLASLETYFNEKGNTSSATLVAEAKKNTYANAAYITMPDVARILKRPTRNSALRNTINSMGLTPTVRPVQITASTPDKVIYRKGKEVAAYPKASILSFIANDAVNLRKDQRENWIEPATAIRTTKEIAETLRVANKRDALNHAIAVAGALETPKADLAVDPYLLGVWLGDGLRNTGVFCGVDHEIASILETRGHTVRVLNKTDKNPDMRYWRIEGLTRQLSELGVISKYKTPAGKYIPSEYLRSSIAQRSDLLAGLLDTDGTVSPQGNVQFDNTNERLANNVLELARSLGYRATKTTKRAIVNGKDCGETYRISWTTQEPAFKLSRKLEAQRERTVNYNEAKNSRRYITEVRKVDSVPVRCITVDSSNHLFLAGEAMIPTHNTQQTAYLLASMMRHTQLGMIIVDPQGQWAAEEGMAFSLQGFSQELGKDVRVRRISEHLQLTKDATLFTTLLGKTRFLKEVTKMSDEVQVLVLEEMAKIVKTMDDWHIVDSNELMLDIFRVLIDENQKYMSRIYADETRQERLRDAIFDILSSSERAKEVLRFFFPIHNLFQPINPMGGPRHSLWAEISSVFERDGNSPAPLLILDMSSKAPPGMDDEVAMAAAEAYEVLENDSVKAAILRNLFSTLKRASEAKFRDGVNLNTMVILDEAWRYAPNPSQTDDYEIAELSRELAGYARDTRKFGIGWLYISQSTFSVNQSIWEQMTIRIFGFGLSGRDLEKITEIIDDRNSLRLYRGFGNPRATGKFPFLLTGPVSPLAANSTPISSTVYTDFQDFRDDNAHWINPIRERMGLEPLAGVPVAPKGSGAVARPKISSKAKPKDERAAIVETNLAIKENLNNTGVKDAKSFGNPLDDLDNDVPF